MPHNLKNLTKIKQEIYPLTAKSEECLKSLILIAFSPQPSISFDLNDLLGLLLLLEKTIEKAEEIDLYITVLYKTLTPSQFNNLTTRLIKHEVQNFYTSREDTFLRSNSLLTKMFSKEFPQDDNSFIDTAGLYLTPLAIKLAKEFSSTLYVSWDQSFINEAIGILQNFLKVLISPEYLQSISDVIKQNCYILLTQLQLYAPYVYDDGSVIKTFSSQQQNEVDAAKLNLSLLVKVGSYFFLRYLIPNITSFRSHTILAKSIDGIPLDPIISRLEKASDDDLVSLIEELKHCRFDHNHEHLEELRKLDHSKRFRKPERIKTLAKYLLMFHFDKMLITCIAAPLQKLIDSIDPKIVEENITWSNVPAWNKALKIFFQTPPSKTYSSPNKEQHLDWRSRFSVFLKKLSQKPTVAVTDNQLTSLSNRSRSKSSLKDSYQFGTKILEVLSNPSKDPWVPNNSFVHAIKSQHRYKVEWFLLRVGGFDLLQGIEVAYLTAQRTKVNIPIKMIPQTSSTESRPSSTIEEEDSEMTEVPLFNFVDKDPKKHGNQVIHVSLTILQKLELYLINPQLLGQIFDHDFTIEVTPPKTQDLTLEAILKLLSASSKSSPRTTSSSPPGRWVIYCGGHHSKGKQAEEDSYDLMPILERALRKLSQKPSGIRLDLRFDEPAQNSQSDLYIAFLFQEEVLCEIQLKQILQVIIQLFEQENISKKIEDTLLDEISRCYFTIVSTLNGLNEALQPIKLPTSNQKLIEISLSALKTVPVVNLPNLLESILTLFAKNDIHGLQTLRQNMAEDTVTQVLHYHQKLLGNDDVNNQNNLKTTDMLFLLLNHLIRTEQPKFTLTYIANNPIYKHDFQKRLMCCFFLRQCLVPTIQQTPTESFRAACSNDITLVRLFILHQNKNLRLDNIPRDIDNQVKTLLPHFTENVKVVPISLLSPRSDSPRTQSNSPRLNGSPRGSSFLERGGLLRKGSRPTEFVDVDLGGDDESSKKSSSGVSSATDSPRRP